MRNFEPVETSPLTQARMVNVEADMALPFEQIKEEALSLDLDSRATLARELLVSLDEPSDAENERLWLDEAERRQSEVRAGRVALEPGDQVMERLNKALG
jgi:Putative addiction module component